MFVLLPLFCFLGEMNTLMKLKSAGKPAGVSQNSLDSLRQKVQEDFDLNLKSSEEGLFVVSSGFKSIGWTAATQDHKKRMRPFRVLHPTRRLYVGVEDGRSNEIVGSAPVLFDHLRRYAGIWKWFRRASEGWRAEHKEPKWGVHSFICVSSREVPANAVEETDGVSPLPNGRDQVRVLQLF